MPSVRNMLAFGLGLAACAQAYSIPSLSERHHRLVARQESAKPSGAAAEPEGSKPTPPAEPAPSQAAGEGAEKAAPSPPSPPPPPPMAEGGGITDVDILQFALTLEHLESAFYAQGFKKFPDSDFAALGLEQAQIDSLKTIGATETTHVLALLGAIAQAGQQPVQACTYNFDLPDAKTMLGTARVLEAVGVSAYLGAAPLVSSPAVLGTAASIATVEARHQTLTRVLSGAAPVPAPFDTALGVKSVFTLAAPFIASCPEGSALGIVPNTPIALQTSDVKAGHVLSVQDPKAAGDAAFCAFMSQGATQFVHLAGGQCQVPTGLAGEVYMLVTKSPSVADAEVVAGPSVILIS